MKQTIAVAISGGIDSMIAAYILKSLGHRVFGIHFVTGYEAAVDGKGIGTEASSYHVRSIAEQLGIDVLVHDCKNDFEHHVIEYFVHTYAAARTPNPCLVCNPKIKFGTIWSIAREMGADRLATGHYARIDKDIEGRFHLYKGADERKDQSYFLARLNRQQLENACFPLGGRTKSEVRALARANHLYPVISKESQDVCFIKRNRYGDFVATRPDFGFEPGLVETTDGKIIGEHSGLHLFTIGQRRGINCPAAEPYYVIKLDKLRNRLIVGSKNELQSRECIVKDINWIVDRPKSSISILTRIRYRHREQASRLTPVGERGARVRFETPQEAVTPGQGAVFYRGNEVLGGGFIET
jgi:tRNA-specific 2-thiouridylase